jgi:hypothetical protein
MKFMKKLILLLLLAVPALANAQTEIPKGSDKIVVNNTRSAEDNFKLAKQLLADDDIEILSQDKDIFQINTGGVRISNDAKFSYLINCREGKVTITGTWGTTIGLNMGGITSAPSTYAVTYKGGQKELFNRMDTFAKQLADVQYVITYTAPKPKKNKDDVYGN